MPIKKHGMTNSAEYRAWAAMKDRCSDPRTKCFKHYGARGIKVCARWRESFENFYADMGPRPGKGYSLERKDNDGDYEPGNCAWATFVEQNNNNRNTKLIEFRGVKLSVSAMERLYNLPPDRLSRRLRDGWDLEKAILTPARKKRPDRRSKQNKSYQLKGQK